MVWGWLGGVIGAASFVHAHAGLRRVVETPLGPLGDMARWRLGGGHPAASSGQVRKAHCPSRAGGSGICAVRSGVMAQLVLTVVGGSVGGRGGEGLGAGMGGTGGAGGGQGGGWG